MITNGTNQKIYNKYTIPVQLSNPTIKSVYFCGYVKKSHSVDCDISFKYHIMIKDIKTHPTVYTVRSPLPAACLKTLTKVKRQRPHQNRDVVENEKSFRKSWTLRDKTLS